MEFSSTSILTHTSQSSEAEAKFKQGLVLIQEGFAEKTQVMLEENTKWKELVQKQRKQIAQFESELAEANSKIGDLEAQLTQQRKELATVTDAKNLAIEKYNTLKKTALSLQKFKKSIITMVEKDGRPLPEDAEDIASLNGTLSADTESSFELRNHYEISRKEEVGNSFLKSLKTSEKRQVMTESQSKTRVVNGGTRSSIPSTTTTTTTTRSVVTPKGSIQSSERPFSIDTKESTKIPIQGPSSSQTTITENANELYKEVKKVLSPTEFSTFADNINRLNNGEQTIDQTINSIGRILKDPTLFQRLQNLIRQAEEANDKDE